MKEIERKFLVNPSKWEQVEKPKPYSIVQGYLFRSEELVGRVRIKNTKAFFTLKGKNTGITRNEFEYEIPLEDAKELLAQFCPKRIEKNRYEIVSGNFIWEVDEFINPHPGLLLAEIELKNENDSFPFPDWVSEEVSHNPAYFNSNML